MDTIHRCERIHTLEEEFSGSLAGGDGDAGDDSSLNSPVPRPSGDGHLSERLLIARQRREKATALMAQGLSRKQCAEAMGCTPNALNHILLRAGVRVGLAKYSPEKSAKIAEELAELLKSGLTRQQCSEQLGVPRSKIDNTMVKHGLRSHGKPQQTTELTLKIAKAIKAGKTRAQCAQMFGVTLGTVSGVVFRHKLAKYTRPYMFNPCRDAILIKHYPIGTPTQTIAAMCEQLPGLSPITSNQVVNRASFLKLRRPEEFTKSKRSEVMSTYRRDRTPAHRPTSWARPPREIEQVHPDPPPPDNWMPGGARPPVGHTLDDIKSIAAREGVFVSSLDDLVYYNRSRMRRNLAPYAVSNMPQKWKY